MAAPLPAREPLPRVTEPGRAPPAVVITWEVGVWNCVWAGRGYRLIAAVHPWALPPHRARASRRRHHRDGADDGGVGGA